MSRITALMLALAAVVACQGKGRQTGMRESAGGAVAPGAAPSSTSVGTSNAPSSTAAGAARASSSATKNAADTLKNRTSAAANTMKNKTGAAMSKLGNKTRATAESAGGAVAGATAGAAAAARGQRFNLSKLSRDQVMQLQSALDSIGCNAGPKDGVAGQKTRQAVACGMQKNNIPSNNVDSLYRSLHLNFQR